MGNLVIRRWHRVITLNGYVAFNLPRTVTALGSALLTGVAVAHIYAAVTAPTLPLYFGMYTAAVAVGCAVAAGAMTFGRKPGWYLGSIVCVLVLVAYLASRVLSLPGLQTLSGRWDVAPATFAAALAVGFIAVHITVLSGINVAYPQRQAWSD